MQRLRLHHLRAKPKAHQGIGIAEPLVLSVMLAIVVGATALMFNSINRQTIANRKQVVMLAAIDGNLQQIKELARLFTCCSGVCRIGPPATDDVGFDANSNPRPCATNNPLDDRYYFPQVDRASTPFSEPLAVDQICRPENNMAFMTPFRTAIDALDQPLNATRTTTIQPLKTLRVEFTDRNNNNRSVRVAFITPAMANYCP
jgi:hypothetical protein